MTDKNNPNKTFAQTQCNQILSLMKTGHSITGLEALKKFGVMHLPRRILDLKERGHKIKDEWVKLKSGKRFKKYFLAIG